MASETVEKTTDQANCHCGSTKFIVSLPPLSTVKVNHCNCSICTHNGYLLVYPTRSDVKFQSGYDDLSVYQFGNKNVKHKCCPKCGTSILIDFGEVDLEPKRNQLGVNARSYLILIRKV